MEQLIPLPVFLVFHWHFTWQELPFKMILKNRCLILVDSHRSSDTSPFKYIYIYIYILVSNWIRNARLCLPLLITMIHNNNNNNNNNNDIIFFPTWNGHQYYDSNNNRKPPLHLVIADLVGLHQSNFLFSALSALQSIRLRSSGKPAVWLAIEVARNAV